MTATYVRDTQTADTTVTGTAFHEVNLFQPAIALDKKLEGSTVPQGAVPLEEDEAAIEDIEPPVACTNLLANPGFETGTTSGWPTYNAVVVDDGNAHTGSYALKHAGAGIRRAQAEKYPTRGASFTFSAWGKAADPTTPSTVTLTCGYADDHEIVR